MDNQTPLQAIVVDATSISSGQKPINLAVFNADGTARPIPKRAAAQVDTTAADLAALKVDFNALLAKFRTAGIMAP